MKNRYLLLLNGLIALCTIAVIFNNLPTLVSQARYAETQHSATTAQSPTHLAFITYPQTAEGEPILDFTTQAVNTLVYPLTSNGLDASQPFFLFSQPDPTSCETDQAIVSPNGQYLLLQYNCHADLFARLLQTGTTNSDPVAYTRGYVLDWSPDGDWFLFRNTDDDTVTLIEAATLYQTILDLPFGTYNATFTPDGQHITYAASRGLGFGSELGTLNLSDGSRVVHRNNPATSSLTLTGRQVVTPWFIFS